MACKSSGYFWNSTHHTTCLLSFTSGQSCGSSSSATTGSLAHYYGPSNNYGPSVNCELTITAAPGSSIVLIFTKMDIELDSTFGCAQNYDWLALYEGSSTTAQQKYCSSSIPSDYTGASGSSLRIQFKSDSIVEKTGWALEWYRTAGTDNKWLAG